MGLGEIIRQARIAKGMSKTAVAAVLGVTDVTVGLWERGETAPTGSNLLKAADVLGIDPDVARAAYEELSMKSRALADGFAPIYATIAAGVAIEQNEIDGSALIPPRILKDHPNGFFLRASGESENKIVPNGFLVFVDPDMDPSDGDLVAVNVYGGDATVKRWVVEDDACILRPESFDESFVDQRFENPEEQEVRKIGVVVWAQSEYRYGKSL